MNKFEVAGPTCISFSGGRTSGYMLWLTLQAHGGKLPPETHVVFANTGKEEEATIVAKVSQPKYNPRAVWRSQEARKAHNLEDVGSNPTAATTRSLCRAATCRVIRHYHLGEPSASSGASPVVNGPTMTAKRPRQPERRHHHLGGGVESTCSQGNRDTQHRQKAPVRFRWADWSCGPAGENGARDGGARQTVPSREWRSGPPR